jgi:hypothetical protein
MKKSFKYLLKQSLPLIVVLTVVFVSIYDLSCLLSNCHYEYVPYAEYLSYPDATIYEIVIMLSIASAVIPIINFGRYKNKNAVDVYFSLPLTKNSFYAQKLIIGFIAILIPFTISYFIGLFILLARQADFYMLQYLPLYFLLVIGSLFMYIICSFFVIKANNVVDSIIFIVLFTLITSIMMDSLNRFIYLFIEKSNIIDWRFDYLFAPYSSLYHINIYYKFLLKTKMPNYSFSNQSVYIFSMVVALIVNFVFAALSLVGIFIHIKKMKNEDAEERSKTWFGYKTMIPILFTIVLMQINWSTNFVNYFLLSAVYIVSYIVLTMAAEFRSVRIDKSRYITLISIYAIYTTIYFIAGFDIFGFKIK